MVEAMKGAALQNDQQVVNGGEVTPSACQAASCGIIGFSQTSGGGAGHSRGILLTNSIWCAHSEETSPFWSIASK